MSCFGVGPREPVAKSIFTVLHALFTIHYLPFTIYHSPFTIHHLPFTVHHSLSFLLKVYFYSQNGHLRPYLTQNMNVLYILYQYVAVARPQIQREYRMSRKSSSVILDDLPYTTIVRSTVQEARLSEGPGNCNEPVLCRTGDKCSVACDFFACQHTQSLYGRC